MGWWEKFNKWADEPCGRIRIVKKVTKTFELSPEEIKQIATEQNKAKQIGTKQLKAIDIDYELLE